MKKFLFLLPAIILMWFDQASAKDYATFTAEIANRNGDVIYILNGSQVLKKIEVNKKGIFKDTLKVKEGFYTFFDGVEYSDLYLRNGYDLKMKLDAKNFDASMSYSGTGADENNFLAESIRINASDEGKIMSMSPEDALQFISKKMDADIKRLEGKKFDQAFVQGKKQMLEREVGQIKMYFMQKIENGKMNTRPSPLFEYENHKGGKTSLLELRGKYVYIDIWATWCGPCRTEIPSLQKVEEKFSRKNIEFVSISVDVKKDYEKWRKFVTDKNLGGIQLIADNDWNSEFIRSFAIQSIPRFILIAPDGSVLDADAKRPSDPSLTEQLEKLLK